MLTHKRIIKKIMDGISLPIRGELSMGWRDYMIRDQYTSTIGWLMPTKHNYNTIADNISKRIGGDILSIGSGSGILEKWLQIINDNIRITLNKFDEDSDIYRCNTRADTSIENVIYGDGTKINLQPYKGVLLSWPPYDEPLAERVWKNMVSGQYIFYIGESQSGCNATHEFFEYIEDNIIETVPLDTWSGIHDYLFIIKKP